MPARPALDRMLRAWYLATPLVIALDALVGLGIRTPFLDGAPALRWAWYAGTSAAALVAWRWPRLTPVVGLVESGLDIVVFVLSAGMAYIRAASGEGEAVFTGRAVANLILSGTVLSASYMVARTRLAARPRRG